jgi:phage terminase large subunit-like protein
MAPRPPFSTDASGGGDVENHEVGIVAAGVDEADHGWVLCDASGHMGPNEWGQVAVKLYRELRADRIVGEVNYGGAMVEAVLRAVDRISPSPPCMRAAARCSGQADRQLVSIRGLNAD